MMKKFFTLLFIVLFAVVGYVYYYFDSIVHKQLELQLTKSLGVQVTVGNIFFKVIDGKFALKDIKISNPKGFKSQHALIVNKVDVSVDMNSIFENLLIIKHVKIENPNLFYEIGADGDNIRAIKKRIGTTPKNNSTSTKGASSSKSTEKKIIIHKFFINNGLISTEIKNIDKRELKLPDIYLQNIGKDQQGITIENAASQVMRELLKAISKVNLRSLFDEITGLPDSLPGLKDRLEGKIKDKTEGFLKNLIKN